MPSAVASAPSTHRFPINPFKLLIAAAALFKTAAYPEDRVGNFKPMLRASQLQHLSQLKTLALSSAPTWAPTYAPTWAPTSASIGDVEYCDDPGLAGTVPMRRSDIAFHQLNNSTARPAETFTVATSFWGSGFAWVSLNSTSIDEDISSANLFYKPEGTNKYLCGFPFVSEFDNGQMGSALSGLRPGRHEALIIAETESGKIYFSESTFVIAPEFKIPTAKTTRTVKNARELQTALEEIYADFRGSRQLGICEIKLAKEFKGPVSIVGMQFSEKNPLLITSEDPNNPTTIREFDSEDAAIIKTDDGSAHVIFHNLRLDDSTADQPDLGKAVYLRASQHIVITNCSFNISKKIYAAVLIAKSEQFIPDKSQNSSTSIGGHRISDNFINSTASEFMQFGIRIENDPKHTGTIISGNTFNVKYVEDVISVVCHEDSVGKEAELACFTLDEGRPLAEGLQDHLANYLMRL